MLHLQSSTTVLPAVEAWLKNRTDSHPPIAHKQKRVPKCLPRAAPCVPKFFEERRIGVVKLREAAVFPEAGSYWQNGCVPIIISQGEDTGDKGMALYGSVINSSSWIQRMQDVSARPCLATSRAAAIRFDQFSSISPSSSGSKTPWASSLPGPCCKGKVTCDVWSKLRHLRKGRLWMAWV